MSNPFEQLFEAAPDAMLVVDAEGGITIANRQTERLFGYARDELVGQGLDILVPERFRRTHGGHVSRYFSRPSARPMGSGLELFGRRKDGTEFPIEVSLSPIQLAGGPAVAAAIRDITERKRMEAITRLYADRLTNAIEAVPEAFAIFDADDRLVQCNSAYRRLIGENFKGPLVGMPFVDILDAKLHGLVFADDAEREAYRQERLAHRRDGVSSYEVRWPDGRTYRSSLRRTTEGGLVQTFWDLTEDAQREAELREARLAAEAGSAAKSEFLSSMSHELRTPLNAVLGFAQLLQRDRKEPLSPRQLERVDQILKGGEHLLRLIDDVLDLARIEAGRTSLSTEPVDVAPVLDEVMRTLEPAAARANVKVVLAPLPGALMRIAADRTRFVQILMNYGSNAIKYNKAGGSVTFEVAMPSSETVRVTVRDTGIGIPVDKQSAIFQPFQRAGQETGPIEGTGIGLTITKRLAELMNGAVGFDSAPERGSEFWIELPAEHARAESAPPPAEESAPLRMEQERAGVVLYVEDNPANVAFMRDLLSVFESIELLTASTAEEGLDIARARLPKAIIMDINLPGMSGLEALKTLRGEPATAHIPVIALTAAATARDRERGEQAGFYRYLTKPVKVIELEAALEPILAQP